jgi:hypothetical protein
MRRSSPVKVAVAILLLMHSGFAARGEYPSTMIRLVDADGRPVARAVVSPFFSYDPGHRPSLMPTDATRTQHSDDRGEASLSLTKASGLCAVREQQGRTLVGAIRVTSQQLGKPVQLVMHPSCRVRFRVECRGFRELEEQYHAELPGPNWRSGAYAGLGGDKGLTWFVYTASTTGELEFLLPPGHFTIMAYGTDTDPVNRAIEIQPGHRVRNLGIVDLPPSAALQHGVFRGFWGVSVADRGDELAGEPSLRRVAFHRPDRGPIWKGATTLGIQHLAFAPNGSILASSHGYNDRPGDVKLWDARTGNLIASLTGPGGEDAVHDLAFSPDGTTLAGSVASLHNSTAAGIPRHF